MNIYTLIKKLPQNIIDYLKEFGIIENYYNKNEFIYYLEDYPTIHTQKNSYNSLCEILETNNKLYKEPHEYLDIFNIKNRNIIPFKELDFFSGSYHYKYEFNKESSKFIKKYHRKHFIDKPIYRLYNTIIIKKKSLYKINFEHNIKEIINNFSFYFPNKSKKNIDELFYEIKFINYGGDVYSLKNITEHSKIKLNNINIIYTDDYVILQLSLNKRLFDICILEIEIIVDNNSFYFDNFDFNNFYIEADFYEKKKN